ncbi:MAG TPA: DNA cytosine methyltransferase [Solirubrobacteraceae bacterium]
MDVIDLFSGCGGMSAGFRLLNAAVPAYRLIAALDVDPVANRTYARNLGRAPLDHDVAQLARTPERLAELCAARRAGHPLVLIGCAPCQGFSSHRNSAGADDARNTLFGDFISIAGQIRPDVVVVENVPELVTDRYWAYVADARRRLSQAGYAVHVGVHNMAHFGVPQERFRVLLLATRKVVTPLRTIFARPEFRTVRHAIADLPPIAAGERCAEDPWHYTAGHRESTLEVLRAVPRDGGSRPMEVGPESLRRAFEKSGKPAYEDVYGRLAWDKPSVTITNYARNPASGRYAHPEQDRGLSIREAALLQSFPRAFEFEGTLDPCFRQIGNAVPPVFAAAVAAHVLDVLLADDDRSSSPGIERPVGPSFSRLIPALKRGARTLEALH